MARFRVASQTVDSDPATTHEYVEKVRMLSAASVRKYFDPFIDIDWDSPELAVDANVEGWILPDDDTVGRHPWYKALPVEKKIEIGKYRNAQMAKVGVEMENLMISGVAMRNFSLPNCSPEFEFSSYEMIEEHKHNLMFMELIRRIGLDVPGSKGLRSWRLLGAVSGAFFPDVLFMIVLSGEEPLDRLQRMTVRAGDKMHPLARAVASLHIQEEARHQSFAHELLRDRVPRMNTAYRFILSMFYPVLIRLISQNCLIPPEDFFREFGVPKKVRNEMFYSDDALRTASEYFTDSRSLAHEFGLMNPVAKSVWKMLRMDGGASRFQSEPVRVAS
ncbi:diiron oxygenase [Nocardia sp. CNY236]|uniref:AurF N-oxygenase family protein n=1 Tax=Nocardia sp. CNY236 TaxID=1169152 RepID=UPI00041196BD|nr:diiron oxygenase [Nocardia sp. CNY236]